MATATATLEDRYAPPQIDYANLLDAEEIALRRIDLKADLKLLLDSKSIDHSVAAQVLSLGEGLLNALEDIPFRWSAALEDDEEPNVVELVVFNQATERNVIFRVGSSSVHCRKVRIGEVCHLGTTKRPYDFTEQAKWLKGGS